MFMVEVEVPQGQGAEIRRWILDNTKADDWRYKRVTFDKKTYAYIFQNEEEAVAFKLAWG